jgi:Tfp pilus assembly protein PilN
MIEINLLPKGYLKGTRSFSLGKVGVYMIAAAAGIILMLGAVTFYQMHQLEQLGVNIAKANQRASVLQKDIKLVDGLTDIKYKISNRMVAVERLDHHRSVWVKMLEDVARNVPEFVWLAVYKEKPLEDIPAGDSKDKDQGSGESTPTARVLPSVRPVEVEGYAFTLNALASLMINMMRSDYFDEVELMSSRETKFGEEKEKAFNFVISCNAHYLSDEDLQMMVAQSSADKSQTSKTAHKVLN